MDEVRRTVGGAFLVAATDAVVLPPLVRFISLPVHDAAAIGAEQQANLAVTVGQPALPDGDQTTKLYSKIATQVI